MMLERKRIPDEWYRRVREIETLDPETDAQRIVDLFTMDFGNMLMIQMITGNMITFAAPSMSKVHEVSREVETDTEKRSIDTALFHHVVAEHGFDPGPGREAAKMVNDMHRHYDIVQEDYLAVAADNTLTPIRLADKFGWRRVTPNERLAMRVVRSREARMFGSHKPLPDTLAEVEDLYENYLNEKVYYYPYNEQVARAFLKWMPSIFPAKLGRPLVWLLLAQVDPRQLRACGLKTPGKLRSALSDALMRKLGSKPADDVADGATGGIEILARRVYPNGWDIHSLGPNGHSPHARSRGVHGAPSHRTGRSSASERARVAADAGERAGADRIGDQSATA
ncbi:oxygenase MpaB family protein [Nocardia abscessus]|uniref:oxygenase MpaB family protein n=1 Tax=Nocardia abscessus TaxID=120957 RepID=UPI00245750DA|nr:oxygenase MpaB family protein [Nocardia abscessus]